MGEDEKWDKVYASKQIRLINMPNIERLCTWDNVMGGDEKWDREIAESPNRSEMRSYINVPKEVSY